MSRVGKYPIMVPSGISVSIGSCLITVQGKRGLLSMPLKAEVSVVVENNKIWVRLRKNDKFSRAIWGTTRANIHNMITGVEEGFSKRLDIIGVGYKAVAQGAVLSLALGFSHDILYPIPNDVLVKCDSPTTIEISGISRERVGQVAADIRSYRPPEPYKGKGVKYSNEKILRKEGKKK